MNWILELTCPQWTYVLVKVAGIIGLLYAACSSMLSNDRNILMKSYNVLPDMKVYGLNKENVILNIPMDIVYDNLKENTSLFIGFIVSVVGFVLEIVLEIQEISGKKLLILAVPLSIVCYLALSLLSKVITNIRYTIICYKIENNKVMPVSYNVFETDNVDNANGYISSKKYVKNCSWERMIIDGKVQEKKYN